MSKNFKTFLKHTAKDYHNQSVNPPVVRASTIIFKSMQDIRKTQNKAKKDPTGGHFDYGRQGTSTTHALQKILTKMEECHHVFLTPTGFGSVFLAIFSVVRPGEEILVSDPVYSPTRLLTQDFLKEFNIKTVFYNPHDLNTLEKNINKNTKLIFVESPGSNSFEFQDLGKIISIAKKYKLLTAIDNTWGTPYFFKPIKFGFDMSIVSATKYYSGHSDVMGGSLAVNKKVFKRVDKANKITGLRLGPDDANTALHNSDLILSIGARFDDRVTNATEKFCPTAKIIHIDIDPSSISKTIAVDVPIVGPAKSVLQEMLGLLAKSERQPDAEAITEWWGQINHWRLRHGGRYEINENGMLKPQQVIEALYEVTKGDAYICSDVGQHQMFAAQYYKFDKPNRWINSGGLGTMGFGFPAAMGVKLHYPDAEVVCVTGEGSFQMNLQEFSTCSQYDIPVKIVCLNNQSLGMVRQWQDMNYESRHSQSYMKSLPDFHKLTSAYGHKAITVKTQAELIPALEQAFALKDELVFLDIYVDPAEHVYPMLVPKASMRDMWLSKTERT